MAWEMAQEKAGRKVKDNGFDQLARMDSRDGGRGSRYYAESLESVKGQ